MARMIPLAIFVGVTILCQCVSVVSSMVIDELGYHWFSIIAFGTLYFVMFAVAWKITVLIVDRYLVPRGYVDGGEAQPDAVAPLAPAATSQPAAQAKNSHDLAA